VSPGSAAPFRCDTLYQDQIELNQGGTGRNVYTYYTYDDFGNVTSVLEQGDTQSPADDRYTERGFRPAPGPYIVGALASETVRAGPGPSSPPVRSSRFCYDGDNLNCSSPPTKGLITARLDWTGHNEVETDYFYDSYGNLACVRDANKHGTCATFDPTYHIFPESSTNALSQTEHVQWDPVLDRAVTTTDLNGGVTRYDHDALGRLTGVTYPGGEVEHRQYLDDGQPARQRIRVSLADGSPDGLWTDTYRDGLGRSWRTAKKGTPPGTVFAQDTAYADASPALSLQSRWYRLGVDQPQYNSFGYDGSGRILRQTHPDGSERTFDYGNDASRIWVTTADERKQSQTTIFDALGRVSELQEHTTASTTSTRRSYDALDRLVAITDDAGNVSRFGWDYLSRLVRSDDPDLGVQTFTYDNVGNLWTQTDGNHITLSYEYDALNRAIRKIYPSGEEDRWRYDEPGHGDGVGHLTSVLDPSASGCAGGVSQQLGYDIRGRITTETKCIQGRGSTITFTYDGIGRQASVRYPDGELVTSRYDEAGRLSSVPGYAKLLEYDAAGDPTRIQLANRTVATYSYDPARGWLTGQRVTMGPHLLLDATYKYAANGLVSHIASKTNIMNSAFRYDELGRLVQVTGNDAASFSYDSIGNVTSNSLRGTYDYPPPGPNGCGSNKPCRGPHAASRAGTWTLSYDGAGNLTSNLDNATHAHRDYSWNADNQPEWLWDYNGQATHNVYDASGARVSRWRGNDTTYYYDQYYDYSSTAGLIKYYWTGPLLVAQRDKNGALWLHPDRLGSTRLITDAAGRVHQRIDYQPFGRKSQWTGLPSGPSTATEIQFAGQRSDDDNGLIKMGSRWYDPWLARFLSPDPEIPDPGNPQALNRYSYAYNSPLAFTDPSGHEPLPTIKQLPPGGYTLMPPILMPPVEITAPPTAPKQPSPTQTPPNAVDSSATAIVIISHNFGFGYHAALWVNSNRGTLLFNPGGSFRDDISGSGGFLEGEDANLAAFVAFERDTSGGVSTYRFDISQEDASKIVERINPSDTSPGIGGGPGSCSISVCKALAGVGPFRDLSIHLLPGNLESELQSIRGEGSTWSRLWNSKSGLKSNPIFLPRF